MVSFPQGSSPEPCAQLSCPAHLILLDYTTRTILGKEYRSPSSSLCNFLHSPVTSSLLGPNTLLSILFSNTLSLRSSLSVSDQVSHPYRTTGNIIVLYILMLHYYSKIFDSAAEGHDTVRWTTPYFSGHCYFLSLFFLSLPRPLPPLCQ